MKSILFKRAVNPHQYDLEDTNWQQNFKGLDSPTRLHFWGFIKKYSHDWKNKKFLDIGSGTGWLPDLALKTGAIEAVGIDPSEKNIKVAKKLYPQVQSIETTLEDFQSTQKYDVITALYSLTHIADIDIGFAKINQYLSFNGKFITIVPDFSFIKQNVFDYEVQIQELNDQEYVVQNKRTWGTITDVVRTTQRYVIAGKKCGLKLIKDIPMKPDSKLMNSDPKYKIAKDFVMTHLLIFSKI